MDLLTFIGDYSELGAGAILVFVILAIFTDRLIPGRAHRREVDAANRNTADWKATAERKDDAINRLLDQNSALLAGVRIADKFYKDFLPPMPDEPRIRGGGDVVA
jgi:hypothetical protein